MQEKDRKEFKSLMARAKVSLPFQTSLTVEEEALRIDVFWEALKEYSIKSIVEAFDQLYKELKWFPKPIEIIDHIEFEANQKYLKRENQNQIEYFPFIKDGPREVPEYVKKFFKELSEKVERPKSTLEGEEAEEFERKRIIAKEKAKWLIN